ncbi:MAG: S8 family serine peptidase, partial [Planctomycetes bacterium]|nr:S8 family serine peptidase [Planctomycetota bacterium]
IISTSFLLLIPDFPWFSKACADPLFEPGEITIKVKFGVRSLKTRDGAVSFGVTSLDAKLVQFSVAKIEKRFRHRDISAKSGLPDLSRIYKLTFPEHIDIHLAANIIARDANIEYAEPIPVCYPLLVPNDSLYNQQQDLPQIMAEEAWDIHRGQDGDRPVIVAIIDSGVNWHHPDLAANIWQNEAEIPDNGLDDDNNGYPDDIRGWDFWDDDNDPVDEYGHGTYTSGIAGAVTDNTTGVAAISWNIDIMPIRGYLYQGIIYAAENGADIISNSWGSITYSQAGQDAVDYAAGLGSIIIASAGNGNTTTLHFPSAYAHVISVAAVDENDLKTGYSHYGLSIDISAPGGTGELGIYSTIMDGGYDRSSGTSASGPLVAGLAALIKSYYPDWTGDQIVIQLLATADNIDSLNPGYEGLLGSGRINAWRALAESTPETQFPLKLSLFKTLALDENNNGWLEPGEMVDISLVIQNFSLSGTSNYMAALTTEDSDIEIVSGLYTGTMVADDYTTIENSFQIRIDPDAQPHQASLILSSQSDLPLQTGDELTFSIFIGRGTFRPVSDSPVVADDKISYGNNWVDYDQDGDPDLFVANGSSAGFENSDLYRNDGNGLFTKITEGILVNDGGLSYCSTWADYNNDGFIDVFISNTSGFDNYLYANNGHGNFTKISGDDIVSDGLKSDGCSWADFDNDGFVDLFVASLAGRNNLLYHNNGDGSFTRMTDRDVYPMVGDGGSSNGCAWADYNNDGYPDLFVANAIMQQNRIFLNIPDSGFVRISEGEIVTIGSLSLGGSWGDFDNNGYL